jgi:hypothetical protein
MKRFFIGLVLGWIHFSLLAQGMLSKEPAPEASNRSVAFFLGAGVANGGDTLVSIRFTNTGTTNQITAGGGVYFNAGADWRVLSNFSLQGSLGYHTSYVKGADGDLSFDRPFVEGIGFWHFLPEHRIGLGLRQAWDAKLRGSGAAGSLGTIEFSSGLGTVLEYEWMISRKGASGYGITLRYVAEKYTAASANGTPLTGPEFKGDHMGLGVHFYF